MAIRQVAGLRRVMFCASLWLAAAGGAALAHADTTSPDDAYLNGLLGDWNMGGTVLGKPVRYHARGERVLQGGFLRLHMIDAAAMPKYEADVFLGFDSQVGDYVAHWLDRFGAAGARVVATGTRDGEQLVLNFPYTEAALRDTFSFDVSSGTWTVLLESQAPGGTWSTFASYRLTRPRHGHR